MGILRGVPEREIVGSGIVFTDRGTRLDRVRHQAIVDEIEPGDVPCGLEGDIDGLGIADVPLIDGVACRNLVDLRCLLPLRLARIGHCRQYFIIDADFLGRVFCLRQRIGDDDRNCIADMIGLALGERRMRRHLHRRAVL